MPLVITLVCPALEFYGFGKLLALDSASINRLSASMEATNNFTAARVADA
jgi:hypothetical protein